MLPPTKARELTVEFVKELEGEESATLSVREEATPLRRLRQSHHKLAKLLAQGEPAIAISLITGYDLEYIYGIQANETFQELMAHYKVVGELAEADIRGQMASAGQMALAELTRRLDEEPEEFGIGQLQDTVELLLVKPMQGQPSHGVGANAPAFTFNFVGSQTPQLKDVVEGEIVGESK